MAGNTIKGITIEIAGSTTKLGKALKSVEGYSKDLEKQLKQVDAALKLDPTNTELLTQKQRILGEQVDNTSERLALLKKAQEEASKSVGNYDEWKAAFDPIQEQIDKTKRKLTQLTAEQKKLERAGEIDSEPYRELSAEIEGLEADLKDLHSQSKAVTEQFGNPISTKEYEKLQTEIALTEAKLNSARKEADKVADKLKDIDSGELHEVAEAADDAGESLESARKEAADFGDVLSAGLISEAAGRIADSLKNIAEESKEYLKIMGSLEVSSQQAGYTVLETEDAYRKLYSVLADEQSAATALANFQALELRQEDLLSMIDNCIGGWAKYGDSIPIDSLAESVNETIRAGQVTGTFADILNWGAKEGARYGVNLKENIEFTKLSQKELKQLTEAKLEEYEATKAQYDAIEEWNDAVLGATSAEDFFNLALQQCSSEAERADLVMQAMADGGLADMADKWRENNKALVDSNLAQETNTKLLANFGEIVMPLVTETQDGCNMLLGTMLELAGALDLGSAAEMIDAVFYSIDQLIWLLIDNGDIVLSILAGIGGGLAALKITEFVKTLSEVHSGTLSLTKAFPVLGNAISVLTNPVFIVSAALVSFVALCATKGDEIQSILQKADDFMQNVFAKDWTETFGPVLGGAMNSFMDNLKGAWDGGMDTLNGVIDFIQAVFAGDWESAWSAVEQIFSGILDSILSTVGLTTDDIKSGFDDAIEFVKGLLDFEWKWPKVPLPHFSWTGGFSLNPLSTPKLNVSWYAKGGILNGAQIFGALGNTLLGGGEAGPEAVLPLSSFYKNLRDILSSLVGNSSTSQIMQVQVTIEHFENHSNSNLDELVEYVEDQLQSRISKKEAALT